MFISVKARKLKRYYEEVDAVYLRYLWFFKLSISWLLKIVALVRGEWQWISGWDRLKVIPPPHTCESACSNKHKNACHGDQAKMENKR